MTRFASSSSATRSSDSEDRPPIGRRGRGDGVRHHLPGQVLRHAAGTAAHALQLIRDELAQRYKQFCDEGKLLEAERIKTRTEYDLEMLEEMGYCSGIENYSRPLSGRKEGERPAVLLDFFPEKFLAFIDESHVTLPQVRGMYEGDRSRKLSLVKYGFRLPSRPGQPAAHIQRVRVAPGPRHLRLRHPLRRGGGEVAAARRAGDQADRASRPASRGPAHRGADGRPVHRDPGDR